MAQKDYSEIWISSSIIIVVWADLNAGDTGTPYRRAAFSDSSMHAFGTPAGSTVLGEGSNEVLSPTNWVTLKDSFSNLLSFTSLPACESLHQNTLWFRPRVAGGAAAGLTVIALFMTNSKLGLGG